MNTACVILGLFLAAAVVSANATSESSAKIPGLAPVDVYQSLEKRGFTVKKTIKPDYAEWSCKKENTSGSESVEIFSDDATSVESIRVTVLNYGKGETSTLAKQIMQFVASIPYEKANPAAASKWVGDNLEKGGSTVISGVKFEIIANPQSPRARIMRIASAPPAKE